MREKDELDLLLDAALSTYADPGEHSGLEEKVLAALDAERGEPSAMGKPRQRWLAWAVAIPIAACLLVWLLIGRSAQSPTSQPQIATRSKQAVEATERAKVPQPEHPTRTKARREFGAVSARLKSCPVTEPQNKWVRWANACSAAERMVPAETHEAQTALPKLDVFPTPQPLTPQERGLALVSAQAQVPVREALVQAQNEDDAPVHIAAIHIPPIEAPSQTQP